ncbi:MAG: deoxyribodipyrimidine photo-lyase [Limisphaera sp.]
MKVRVEEKHRPVVVWFRRDLRLADQPALAAARDRGCPVIPVFVWAPDEEEPWPPGAASRWWLHGSLASLDHSLQRMGSRLILRRGPTVDALRGLIQETGAGAVYWNRRSEPAARRQEQHVETALRAWGIETQSFNSHLLFEPEGIRTGSGQPFQVFTAFWRRCLGTAGPERPAAAPTGLPAPTRWPASVPLESLELLPRPDWAAGLRATWRPGEQTAWTRLEQFLSQVGDRYAELRDRPDLAGTSQLSPHLHFGEISPRQIWHRVAEWAQGRGGSRSSWRDSAFLRELGWREFAHYVLHHFPHTATEPLRPEWKRFPWRSDPAGLCAWQRGRTGYPIVDAGMRQLWETGWMHNRVRMIVASFLVKDLRIGWWEGARWFWDTLVDADLANNTLGWQWTAGCGADAAPYFRIFHPVLQGKKFDPEGNYVRRWCPELSRLPARWIHEPFEAPSDVLRDAGVRLGVDYPRPVVSHAAARVAALAAWQALQTGSSSASDLNLPGIQP